MSEYHHVIERAPGEYLAEGGGFTNDIKRAVLYPSRQDARNALAFAGETPVPLEQVLRRTSTDKS